MAVVSRANKNDAVFVFSVGGGNVERQVSMNIVRGLEVAKARDLKVFGILGRDDGFTYQVGDCIVVIPTASPDRVTPHSEAFQSVVWHCLVSHPSLQIQSTKW